MIENLFRPTHLVLVFGVFNLILPAAGVWAVITLHRIRTDLEAMRRTFDSIEGLMQRTWAS